MQIENFWKFLGSQVILLWPIEKLEGNNIASQAEE